MRISLINVFDVEDRKITTELVLPEGDQAAQVMVCFNVTFGPGGAYHLSTVIQSAITDGSDGNFEITDGFDGAQNVLIPSKWIRLLAASALHAVPSIIGTLKLSATLEPHDPRCPF